MTANFPVSPVNSPKTIAEDPQFNDRFHWFSREQLGAEQLPTPIKFAGEELPTPTHAPTVGEHTDGCCATSSGGTTTASPSPDPGVGWGRPGRLRARIIVIGLGPAKSLGSDRSVRI